MVNQIINFFFKTTISYGITVNNEIVEIKKLLDELIPLIDKNDEIIVLQDITNENLEVTSILNSYGTNIKRVTSRLNGDFATFKNSLIKEAKKQYLFQIDADEYPKESLIKKIKLFLVINYKADCFLIPRINMVQGITSEHIQKWKWNLNQDNYINFPDYQTRLFKLGKGIQWKNKVHETLINFIKIKAVPADYDMSLIHIKEIDKQEKQNNFYDNLS